MCILQQEENLAAAERPHYRTTGVRILPGPGPGETKIAGAGGRKLSRILLIYNL